MFKTLVNAFKIKDLRKKILITLGLLILYRVGCALVVPGFNLKGALDTESNGFSFFSMMNMLSGDALSSGSILALGVSPYITASIVIQLLTVAIPALQNLSRQGEDGRKKVSFYVRVAALVLALAQSIGIVVSFSGKIDTDILNMPTWLIGTGIVLILTAGAMFTVWLGEKITQIGVGNGMSLLIFVGIISSAGNGIQSAIETVVQGKIENLWSIIIYIVALVLIFGLIVFIDSSERRVNIQMSGMTSRRGQSNKIMQFIPIRLNAAGVMPIIFASALLTLPQLVISTFWPGSSAEYWYQTYMGTNSWVYIVLLALFIFAFSFFYAQISFDTDEMSKSLKQRNAVVPGIRSGIETSKFLRKISNRITFFGAIYLAFVALIPSLVFKAVSDVAFLSLVNAFSTTGLMIMVSVALETEKSLSQQMIMRNHRGFLN